jgi:aminopeptidase N
MNRFLYLLLIMLTAFSAQAKKAVSCSEAQQHRHGHPKAKVTLASPLLELYDVTHVKLDLSMSNLNTVVAGNAITTARVIDSAGMSRYVFELSDLLTIDSIALNGVKLTAVRLDTDLYAVTPALPIALGNVFTAQVFYHGKADNGTGFFTHGVNHKILGTGTEITFTLSDQFLAKDWWPCKQSLLDKVDSADLWFTVPNNTMAGSNGRLLAVTPMGSASSRYEWKTKYPIEYYLISTAIAPYVAHTQMLHFSGSADSMPVQHFVYDTALLYPQYKAALDSTPGIIDYFSGLYGRYPFWQEKYGHCIAPLSGGMEHQTMTTMTDALTTTLIAHELGHQWWGDCVTYASWRDIWMSEGWAAYSEQLYVEHFRSAAAAQSYRGPVFGRVMSKPGGSVYVDDTSDVYRVFDSRLTYDKGAAVAHMLRHIAPSDAAFFAGLKTYQQQYAYKTATTADFKLIMEAAYGRSLDTFFNQWVFGQGYPTYTATWNQRGADVFLNLEQSTSAPASVAAFSMPLTLQLSSAAGDTLVKVYIDKPQHLFHFKWSNPMTNVVIDPNNDIVNRANPVIHDVTLNVASQTRDNVRVFPNPAGESWQLTGIKAGATIRLLDAGGRIVWQADSPPKSLTIDSSILAPGVYTLVIRNPGSGVITRILQKR